jgi:hypothetical protein
MDESAIDGCDVKRQSLQGKAKQRQIKSAFAKIRGIADFKSP